MIKLGMDSARRSVRIAWLNPRNESQDLVDGRQHLARHVETLGDRRNLFLEVSN